MAYNIQTLNKISPLGLELFSDNYSISDNAENPDAILVRSAAMHDMTFGDKLLAIGRAGAGTNNIPVDKCAEQGIVVFNTPGANANAVKELAITALLLSSRKIPDAMIWANGLKGKGDEVGKLVEKGKSQFVGPEITGKTLGVIGLGAIGILVANAAEALGMKVIGYDPYLSTDNALKIDPTVKRVTDIKNLFASADYITVHVPFSPATKGTINAEALAQCKDGVRIINLARGELVDNAAIISALESGKASAYVTDFPNDEILGVKGVVALPHLGASTPEAEDNCAVMAAKEIIDYLENGNIKNSVNFPNVKIDATGTKVCILHKNVPSLIAKVTEVFGSEGLNIENMVNASKKDYSATLLDVSGDVTDSIVSKLCAVDAVIRVRVIK
ncbi:MAG: 3-phosphoglycerate dehydrogenase [Oscillospiraceae bacterium]|nr:3-phosphoglycerate dehydrogenase [Oscillospiraceae bacterium]MCR5168398.1 3-phosphoglycerate dehydrogenase [Oscillospiraceae bacterium]